MAVSDPEVATVDENGLVTAVAVGTATVTATITATAADGSGLSATCRITAMSGIGAIFADGTDRADVYDLGGRLIMRDATRADVARLPAGIYIVNRRKVALNIAK